MSLQPLRVLYVRSLQPLRVSCVRCLQPLRVSCMCCAAEDCLWALITKRSLTRGYKLCLWWTRIVLELVPLHRLCAFVHREESCRLPARVEGPCSGPKCSSQGIS